MKRILDYAKKQQYTRYTPTLIEAWRLSISGLTLSIINALKIFPTPPEMNQEENLEDDEISQFGVIEAQRHMERGVNLHMGYHLFEKSTGGSKDTERINPHM